jgi:RNA polymerase sigma factor (sigma-70 family)
MRLAEEYLELVPKLAKANFASYRGDWQGLLDAGVDGLLKAEAAYLPARGAFEAFAQACIKNAMRDHMRGQKRLKRKPTLPLDDDLAGKALPDALANADALVALCPDPRTREILLARYGHGLTLREVADAFGLSHTDAWRVCGRALGAARLKWQSEDSR